MAVLASRAEGQAPAQQTAVSSTGASMGVSATVPSSTPGTQSGAQSSHCPAAADVLYREGVDRLAANQNEVAANLFTQVLQLCPTHPTAGTMLQTARSRLQASPQPSIQPAGQSAQTATAPIPSQPWGTSPAPTSGSVTVSPPTDTAPGTSVQTTPRAEPVPPPPPTLGYQPGVEYPSQYARWELIANAGGFGAAEGFGLCILLDCPFGPSLGAAIVGFALGAGAGWIGSTGGVTLGQATAVESGMWWGFADGIGLGLVFLPSQLKVWVGTAMATTAIGTGVGVALAATTRPHSGDVSIANSGGIWAGVLGIELFAAITGFDFPDRAAQEAGVRALAVTGLLTGNLGLVAGALLGPQARYTRQRVLYMDMAVLAGTASGMLTGLLFATATTSAPGFVRTVSTSMALGTALGITAAFVIVPSIEHSRRAVGPEIRRFATSRPSYTFTPMGPEGQPGLTIGGTF